MSRRPRLAWVVFVKTPEYSPVKTRLAAGIGAPAALEFYEHAIELTRALMYRLRDDTRLPYQIEPVWAVAERDALNHPRWADARAVYQGEGELGKRLNQVYSSLLNEYAAVVLTGADCPALDAGIAVNAIETLASRNEFVLGPCEDGGYYLFAGARPLSAETWLSVPYSSAETATVFSRQLERVGRVQRLPILYDIDTESDWRRWKAALRGS